MKRATLLLAAVLAASAAEPYRLGPGDTVVVAAVGAPEIRPDPRTVDPAGELRLPLAGAIRAEGMSASELEMAIAERLRRYIKAPSVAVSLYELGSRPVSVLGAVRNPGVLQMASGRTLAEALSAAGGLALNAGDRVTLTRRATVDAPRPPNAALDGSGEFYVTHIDVRALLEGQDPALNISVYPHDVINVGQSRQVFVIGAVQRPGAFPLTADATSVLEALAMAGGLEGRAEAKQSRILRGETPQARVEQPINLKRVIAGRDPDAPLAAGDILFVPISGSKVAAAEIARAALTIGTGAAIWTAAR